MTRQRRPSPHCDVPGCISPRGRHHRLCERCFRRLPAEIRVGINEAHRQRRKTDWNALRQRAAAFLNLTAAPPPEIVFARNAALLEER